MAPVNGGDIRKLRRRDPFEGEPVSGQYDWSYRECDARLWADYYGIRFREPPSHHFDFWLLARAATAAKRLGRAADYGRRICAAVYGTDTWPIDETVCIALAEEIGLAADLFWATLEDPETERILAAAAEAACGLEILEPQLELYDLAVDALRRAAVLLAPATGELEL